MVVSFSAESNLPPYIDVIFAKAAASVTGTLDSQVLDTTFSSARWDALAWTATTPASTTITLWVRARDTSFLKTDDEVTGPVWTSMGSTSPVQSGLTAGRYKQWRATLNTTNVAQTPTLSDVSLYYSES